MGGPQSPKEGEGVPGGEALPQFSNLVGLPLRGCTLQFTILTARSAFLEIVSFLFPFRILFNAALGYFLFIFQLRGGH